MSPAGEVQTPMLLNNGGASEAVVLGDERDLAAQGLRVPAAERLAVDQHFARGRLVEPGQDLDQRGLAAAPRRR